MNGGFKKRCERGAATLESVGVTIVASVLAVSLLFAATPQGRILGENLSYAICQVVTFGQGGCTPPSSSPEAHKPTEPCVVSQDGVERNQKVAVLVFTAKDGRRIEVAQLSNGEYRITVTDTGGGGLEVGVGGGLTITVNDHKVGGAASAQAGASIDIKAGDVYYTDQDGINDLMDALLQDQVKDAVVGDGGPVRWLTDQAGDLLGVNNNLPEPDETYAEGGISLNASAEAADGLDTASAGIGMSEMLGVRQNRDGTTTVYVKTSVEGQAGLQSLGIDAEGVHSDGAKLEGKIDVVNAVTFDSEGNMIRVQASAVASGSSSGIASALFGGDSDSDISNQVNQATIYQATLNLKDDTDRNIANQYLLATGVGSLGGWTNPLLATQGINATQNFFDAAASRGNLTQQTYDTDSNTVFGVDASGKLGVELGVQASVKEDSMTVTDAKYWDGTQWVDWEECSV